MNEEDIKPFNQIIKSYNIEKDLTEAYEKGFHFHWIAYSHSFTDELMKAFLYIYFNSRRSMGDFDRSEEFVQYMHGLSFYNSLSILHYNCIVSLDLYKNLKKLNSNRNTIMHNLITKIEKVNEINLKEYFETCKKAIKELVDSMLDYVRINSQLQEHFKPMFKDLKEELEKRSKDS